jgi:hypothetical protein
MRENGGDKHLLVACGDQCRDVDVSFALGDELIVCGGSSPRRVTAVSDRRWHAASRASVVVISADSFRRTGSWANKPFHVIPQVMRR